MNILVTGACGFIGSKLVSYLLNQNYNNVIGVDSLCWPNSRFGLLANLGKPRFEFHKIDVCKESISHLIKRSDVVIPLAALVGAPICEAKPELARAINTESIARIVKELSPRQRLIYPNTNSGYGAKTDDTPCRETDEMNPISVYGITKVEGEKIALSHNYTTVFRLATLFGVSPRMRLDLLLNDFVFRLRKWGRLEIYEPHYKRNLVHVDDVARIMAESTERELGYQVYNLGSPGLNPDKMEIAKKICKVLELPETAISIGNGKDPDQRNYVVDNSRLVEEGFRFYKNLDEGIREVNAILSYFDQQQVAQMFNREVCLDCR